MSGSRPAFSKSKQTWQQIALKSNENDKQQASPVPKVAIQGSFTKKHINKQQSTEFISAGQFGEVDGYQLRNHQEHDDMGRSIQEPGTQINSAQKSVQNIAQSQLKPVKIIRQVTVRSKNDSQILENEYLLSKSKLNINLSYVKDDEKLTKPTSQDKQKIETEYASKDNKKFIKPYMSSQSFTRQISQEGVDSLQHSRNDQIYPNQVSPTDGTTHRLSQSPSHLGPLTQFRLRHSQDQQVNESGSQPMLRPPILQPYDVAIESSAVGTDPPHSNSLNKEPSSAKDQNFFDLMQAMAMKNTISSQEEANNSMISPNLLNMQSWNNPIVYNTSNGYPQNNNNIQVNQSVDVLQESKRTNMGSSVHFAPFATNKVSQITSANSATVIDIGKSNEDLNFNYNIGDAAKRFRGIQRPLQFQKAKRILKMKQMQVEQEKRGPNPQTGTATTCILDSLVKRQTTTQLLHKRAKTRHNTRPGDAFEFADLPFDKKVKRSIRSRIGVSRLKPKLVTQNVDKVQDGVDGMSQKSSIVLTLSMGTQTALKQLPTQESEQPQSTKVAYELKPQSQNMIPVQAPVSKQIQIKTPTKGLGVTNSTIEEDDYLISRTKKQYKVNKLHVESKQPEQSKEQLVEPPNAECKIKRRSVQSKQSKRRSVPRAPDSGVFWKKYLVNDIVNRQTSNDSSVNNTSMSISINKHSKNNAGATDQLQYFNQQAMPKQQKIVMKTTRGDIYRDYLEHRAVMTESSQCNSQGKLSQYKTGDPEDNASPYVSAVQVIASNNQLPQKSLNHRPLSNFVERIGLSKDSANSIRSHSKKGKKRSGLDSGNGTLLLGLQSSSQKLVEPEMKEEILKSSEDLSKFISPLMYNTTQHEYNHKQIVVGGRPVTQQQLEQNSNSKKYAVQVDHSMISSRKKAKSRLETRRPRPNQQMSNFPEIPQWSSSQLQQQQRMTTQRPAPMSSLRELKWTPPVDPKTQKVANLNSKLVQAHLAVKRDTYSNIATDRQQQSGQFTKQSKRDLISKQQSNQMLATNGLNPPYQITKEVPLKKRIPLSMNKLPISDQTSSEALTILKTNHHQHLLQHSREQLVVSPDQQVDFKKIAQHRLNAKKHQALIAELEGQGIQVQIMDSNRELRGMSPPSGKGSKRSQYKRGLAKQIGTPRFVESASAKQIEKVPQTLMKQQSSMNSMVEDNSPLKVGETLMADSNNSKLFNQSQEQLLSGGEITSDHLLDQKRSSIESVRVLPHQHSIIASQGEHYTNEMVRNGPKFENVSKLPLVTLCAVTDDQSSITDANQSYPINFRNESAQKSVEIQRQTTIISEQNGEETPYGPTAGLHDSINSNEVQAQADLEMIQVVTKFNLNIKIDDLNPKLISASKFRKGDNYSNVPNQLNPHSSVHTEHKSPHNFSHQRQSFTGTSPISQASNKSPVFQPASSYRDTTSTGWMKLVEEVGGYPVQNQNDYGEVIRNNKALLVPSQKQLSYKRHRRLENVPQTSHTKIDSGLISHRTGQQQQVMVKNPITTRNIIEQLNQAFDNNSNSERLHSQQTQQVSLTAASAVKNVDSSRIRRSSEGSPMYDAKTKRQVVDYQKLGNTFLSQRSSFNKESTGQSPRLDDELAAFMALKANYNFTSQHVLPQVQGVGQSSQKQQQSSQNPAKISKQGRFIRKPQRTSPFQQPNSKQVVVQSEIDNNYQSLSLQDFQFGKAHNFK